MAIKFGGTNDPAPKQDVPEGSYINPERWRTAEDLVRARNGGFFGVSEQGKYNQIKEAYDHLEEESKRAAKWEGKED